MKTVKQVHRNGIHQRILFRQFFSLEFVSYFSINIPKHVRRDGIGYNKRFLVGNQIIEQQFISVDFSESFGHWLQLGAFGLTTTCLPEIRIFLKGKKPDLSAFWMDVRVNLQSSKAKSSYTLSTPPS